MLLTLGYLLFASAYISQIIVVGLVQESHQQLSTTTSIKIRNKLCTREKIVGMEYNYTYMFIKKETSADLKTYYLLFTEEFRNHMQLSFLWCPTKCLPSNNYALSKT
jgi:hypothetical protein